MTRPLTLTFLVLLAAGLGFYGYGQHAALQDALARIESLQAKLAAKTIAPVASAPAPVPPAAPEVVAPGENSGGPEGLPDAENHGGPRGRRGDRDNFFAAMDSPEVQQLLALRARGALDTRYAALFRSLNLSPDQLARFQQLLVDKQSSLRDVITAMRSQGLGVGRDNADEVRAMVQSANAEIEAQIRSTLGDVAFSQYQTYEATQPQRATVEQFQQRLSYSAQPLSEQQASQLVGILAENAPAKAAGTDNGGGLRRLMDTNTPAARITPEAVTAAGAILSPTQLNALQQLQQEQAAQAQLASQARANFNGARPAPAPTP